jgi:cytosine/uracil/thiamine/allantoin permease
MKNKYLFLNLFFLSLVSAVSLTSCQMVQGIFKAGVWVGVIVVVAIIALVIWLISRLGGRR